VRDAGIPAKRAINLSLRSDKPPREVVRREQELELRQDHPDFIAAYNAIVDTDGLPLDVQSDLLDGLGSPRVSCETHLPVQTPEIQTPLGGSSLTGCIPFGTTLG